MFKFADRTRSERAIRLRLIELALASSPLLASYYYSHTARSSPLFCPIRTLTGIPCPGCGMTRSFMAIASGNLSEAFYYNLFGPLVFLGFSIITIHLFCEIVTKRKISGFYLKLAKNKSVQTCFIFAIFIYHSSRLCYLSSTGILATEFIRSPLGQLLF